MIEKTLILLGLKEKEVTVYLEIMRLGKASPAQIAKNTDINRATVYSVSKLLLKKGLIQEDLAGAGRTLIALPSSELDVLVEKERNRIMRKEELVEQAIGELNDLPLNTQYSVPKIRFVEGDSIDLYKDVEKWDASILKTDLDKSWWGFQDKSFVGKYGEWIKWYWERAHADISLQLLSNENKNEEILQEEVTTRRSIKYFDDASSQFTATTWVLGEYLIMMYTETDPVYMIEIHNPTLAHNYRELFKTIWEKY